MRLAPSLLASDLADLAGALAICERGGADLVHFDVMDGHFVPNLSFGIPVLAAVARRTRLPVDVHLMVREPRPADRRLPGRRRGAGGRPLGGRGPPRPARIAHPPGRRLARRRGQPVDAGRGSSSTSCPQLDYVLLMSVNPGFGGQRFLPRALDKARRLAALARAAGTALEIAMDGGIERDNIHQVVAAGVDVCVVGSAIFTAADPVARMSELRTSARSEMV